MPWIDFSFVLQDPTFYALAIPAVLILGISKSGFGAGFGSVAVPLMAMAVPVPQAAAILMPLLLLMDLMGLRAYRGQALRPLLVWMLPCGLLGSLVGFLSFRHLSVVQVSALTGVLTLLFLAQRLRNDHRRRRLAKADPTAASTPNAQSLTPDPRTSPTGLGILLTATSGFTSFVAHAGGPPIGAYMLPLRFPPVSFSATMTVFFFVINLSKWVPYGALGLLDWRNLATSMVLLPLAPIGVWIGVGLTRRVGDQWFYRLMTLGMLVSGVKLALAPWGI